MNELDSEVAGSSKDTQQNKSAKSGMNLHKKTTHIISLWRKRRDTKDNGISLETKQGNMGLWNFDLILEPLSWWKIVYTTHHENKLKSVSVQINKDDGIHLQAHCGGTSLNGIGSVLISNFWIDFVTVGFVYSRWRSTVTDGVCRQIHFTRHFSHAVCTSNYMHIMA